MRIFRHFLCLCMACTTFFSVAFSQSYDPDGGELEYNIYKLPSIEVNVGLLSFMGDVTDFNKNVPFVGKHNFGFGFGIQQRIGSFFGVAAGYNMGKLTGLDTRPGSYYNFQSDVSQADFNIYLHLDNDFIISRSSRFAPYLKGGIGYFSFDPMGDLKDKNGKIYYHWADGTVRDQVFDPENPQNGNILVRDYKYETKLDSLNLHDNNTITIPVGGGIKFKLSDAFEANLALTYVFTSSNFVDDLAFENKSYPLFDRRNDNYLYSSVSIQFNIGGLYKQVLRNKPYRNINFAEIDAMDLDNDGVPESADKCPWTPSGVRVTENGCPLDDDADGVPNYLDKETATLPGSLVDDIGVTITPEMIEAKYIRDSLLMAGELILEKKYSEGTPILTDEYDSEGAGTIYTPYNYPYVKANWPDDVKSIPVKTSSTKYNPAPSNIPKTKPTSSLKSTPIPGVSYKVQIGASQTPLEPSFFSEKFSVKEDIAEELSDGWYRYTVGNFTNYIEARDYVKTQSRVQGAFVVKYQDNQRILPSGVNSDEHAEIVNNMPVVASSFTEPIEGKGVFFRIQIGSSAKKLSPTFFKDNFGINDYIYEEKIEEQYKYTVGQFSSYKEAKKYTESISSVQGAFVTSYRDNVRIPLQDAINATE